MVNIDCLFSRICQILINVLWPLDGEPESNVNPESPKDNILQGIPSIPANPPTTRIQSFESEDDARKTESK